MNSILDIAKIISTEKDDVAICIIISTKGSTPRKIGTKMIVTKSGKIYGTIGGGALEEKVIINALQVIDNKSASVFKHDLLHQHNMCCGGNVEIYIEPIMRKNKLYIFGAGHTGKFLAKYSLDADFEVVLIDDRKSYLDEILLDDINKMNLDFEHALKLLPFDNRTYIAIMTYDHAIDRQILAYCLHKPHAYIGMIGSLRKIELTKKKFIEAKLATPEQLAKVDMPIGIDIHSESPQEIAISIIATLIKIKNDKNYDK
ncbi:MAG: XdhC family protein [Bacteroidia bacterium]|nr:XdhC family protein [Bacteroidia bacterium]